MNLFPEKPLTDYHKTDTGLMVSMILMWGIGLFTLFICSGKYGENVFGNRYIFVQRQLFASLVGLAGLVFFAFTPLSKLRRLLPFFVLIAIIGCLMTFVPVLSEERNGARRWIKLPFMRFQPSEFVKFTFVLFLANLFDKNERIYNEEERSVFPAVVGMLVFIVLIFAQKDFSTGLFIFLVGILMFFMSGARLAWILPFGLLGIPFMLMMILTEPYRVSRLAAFLRPDKFIDTFNYQNFASRRAISTGGFWGQGIGAGLERLNSIPEVQADYIFAGWTEAMGFIGVLLYFAILFTFAYKAYKCAVTCPDRFGSYGTFGCISIILFQSLANLGVVCGLLPTTGIPLPFFSAGGSSMIVTLCMCGFMINVARGDGDSYSDVQKIKKEDLFVVGEGGYERI